MLVRQPADSHVAPRPSAWIHGPVTDVIVGWCWLPIALGLHAVSRDVSTTQLAMAAVFVVSFAHQPVTLGLVYGDAAQRSARRVLYLVTPPIAAAAVLAGMSISLVLVAVVAGLWNAEHTLMQRYGVIRIYGRKAGDTRGRLEKVMLITWLVTALLFLAAYVDLLDVANRVGADQTNYNGAKLLDSLGGVARVLFWAGVAASVVLALRWISAERRAPRHAARSAKWIYVLSTFGLVVTVMIDPLAGIGAYVAAHAIEYFVIVHGSLRRRANAGDVAPIVRVARTGGRRLALAIVYGVAVVVFVSTTYQPFDGRLYRFAVLFFGALHILYDGLVWKLRRPAVAASVGITPVPAAV